MQDPVLTDIRRTPAMINLFPTGAGPVRGYLRVLHDESYHALEVLARPIDRAVALLRALRQTPEGGLLRLGIGTVRTRADAEQAMTASPDFLVSPAFSHGVFDVALKAGIPYIPGVCTLQDVQNVMDAFEEAERPLEMLKLCPVCDLSMEYVAILGALYPGIVFCPTGTVTLEALPDWCRIPHIGPAMESEFVPPELIDAGDWDTVRECLRTVRRIVRNAHAARA